MYRWLFYFYLYSFLGWCFESAYVSVKSKHLVNRGFMSGPFLPIYGSGAVMMLIVSRPFQDSILLTYLAGCVGATLLEYLVGTATEALFQVRYWDYTGKFMNFRGQICLTSTIAWGFFTILMTEVIHRPIQQWTEGAPYGVIFTLTCMLTIYVFTDFFRSFRAALDMRDILWRMDHMKQEMEHMQKRLDVIAAVTGEEIGQYRSAAEMRIEELVTDIEDRLHRMKEWAGLHPGEYLESAKNEAIEIRDRFMNARYHASQLKTVREHWKRGMILGNPTMRGSKKVRYSLEELKEAVKEKLNLNFINNEKGQRQ